jgi:hypothetical protein
MSGDVQPRKRKDKRRKKGERRVNSAIGIISDIPKLWLGGTFECHVDTFQVCRFYCVCLLASTGSTA